MAEDEDSQGGVETVTRPQTKEKVKRPPMYKVLLHNDHYTTREFVVEVLMGVFRHSETDATRIMLYVHHRGVGVAGVFTKEIAEMKVMRVEQLAQEQEFPLRLSIEQEDD